MQKPGSGRGLQEIHGGRTHRRLKVQLGLILLAIFASVPAAFGQASPTASRLGDLQVGAGFTFGTSNYLSPPLIGTGEKLMGFDLYGSLDLRHHLGAELDFRQTSPSYGENVYERTYEAGARYVLPRGRLLPYGKAIYGRGVFNYPTNVANLAYNLVGLGAGADYRLLQSVNLRLDYEYQHWFGFPLKALQPNLVTVGVAYHFSGWGKCPMCANRSR